MRPTVLVVAAVLLMAGAVAQSSDENKTYHECDANGDGQVGNEEAAYCEHAHGDHECDTNQDGTVNETEQYDCEKEYRNQCDFDADGRVSDEEHRKCESQHHNDTNEHEHEEMKDEHHEECESDESKEYGEYDEDDYGEYKSYEEYQSRKEGGTSVSAGADASAQACYGEHEEHESEGYEYPEGHPAERCDFNEDGVVTRDEWDTDRCEEVQRDHYEAKAREYRQEAIAKAKQDGRVSAALEIRDQVLQELQTDDGVAIKVSHESTSAIPRAIPNAVKVTFDADLQEGRTFVLDIDPTILAGDIIVQYFSIDETTGLEEQATINEADDLDDILDPDNDDGAPEYWLVTDSDGLHVMVSIASWSVHSVSMQSSVGESYDVPGAGALAATATVLAAAAVARRRR